LDGTVAIIAVAEVDPGKRERRPKPELSEQDGKNVASLYSEKVLEHFQHPRNVGDLAGADAKARVENPVCGDVMELAVKLSGDRIAEVRYRIQGCVPSVAAGSCLTELIQGRSVVEARSLKREALVDALNGLPAASQHAAHLAMDALATLLNKIDNG
jgi:nitrogen fixation protein NifU and related proteins